VTTRNGLGTNFVSEVSAAPGGYTKEGFPNTLYAATLGGLSISTDGGAYWDTITTENSGLGSNRVNGVFATGNTVYAATDGGLSISTDFAKTFTNYTTANGLGSTNVNRVYASGNTIYAATDGGLSISTNGGTTFTNYTTANGLGSRYVNGVYVAGNTIYAYTIPVGQGYVYPGGLSISTDGGTTFTNRTTANGLGDNEMFKVYADGNTVYAATLRGVSISTDGGTTFTNGLGDTSVNGVYAIGNTIYAATVGGLSISTDGGTNWTNYTTANGLGEDSLTDVYVSGNPATAGGTIYAATYDNGLSISTQSPFPLPEIIT
jgi:hypothetical protein